MIHGVGTDILALSRMQGLPEDDVFFRRAFTEAERAEAAAHRVPLRWYCARFCAKEAVFKALCMDSDAARLDEIEVLEDALGAPTVTLHGSMADFAREQGITQIHLSISWETEYAVSFAVAERD